MSDGMKKKWKLLKKNRYCDSQIEQNLRSSTRNQTENQDTTSLIGEQHQSTLDPKENDDNQSTNDTDETKSAKRMKTDSSKSTSSTNKTNLNGIERFECSKCTLVSIKYPTVFSYSLYLIKSLIF